MEWTLLLLLRCNRYDLFLHREMERLEQERKIQELEELRRKVKWSDV